MENILNAIDFLIIFTVWLLTAWAFVAITDKIGKKLAERRHRKELVQRAIWLYSRSNGRN